MRCPGARESAARRSFAKIQAGQKLLTVVPLMAILFSMCGHSPRSRRFGQRCPHRADLLLELLALRHQLGILARSDRRFRSADRLFWLLAMAVTLVEGCVGVGPAGNSRALAARRALSMLEPSLRA
jgi:hypothetical protein